MQGQNNSNQENQVEEMELLKFELNTVKGDNVELERLAPALIAENNMLRDASIKEQIQVQLNNQLVEVLYIRLLYVALLKCSLP
jgi:hypothetical protein